MLMGTGYADESCWARGQAWGIYGFAQCGQSYRSTSERAALTVSALRTSRKDFLDTSRKLADAFFQRLGPSGVPEWQVRQSSCQTDGG